MGAPNVGIPSLGLNKQSSTGLGGANNVSVIPTVDTAKSRRMAARPASGAGKNDDATSKGG